MLKPWGVEAAVANGDALKYRAFLSYSHADTAGAKWLHRRLEVYRIDRDLVGRVTPVGSIPPSLRPVFRDRDEFTAGHALAQQTIAALDQSRALIVVCSPRSATSSYVDREVQLFRSRHPGRPVIPFIVDGEPGSGERECFPPSLRGGIDAEGNHRDGPTELLAADFRETGDGPELAVAKVVSSLLGLGTDEVFRRAQRERSRRQRRWIAGLSAIALALGGLAVWAEINRREAVAQRQEAERNFAVAKQGADSLVVDIAQGLRNVEGMRTEAVSTILERAERVFASLVERSGDNKELLRSQAVMLMEFADTYEAKGDTAKQLNAAELALAATKRLTAADQGNPVWLADLSLAYEKIGDARRAQGKLPAALEAYRESLGIAERLLERDPDNAGRHRDRHAGYLNVGDVLRQQGNIADALEAYRRDLTLTEAQSAKAPDDAGLQADLSVSHERIGDALRSQYDMTGAIASYDRSRAICSRLVEADPANAGRQICVSVSNYKIGETESLRGNLDAALVAYRDSLAIIDRLARIDPTNADWQRNRAAVAGDIGGILDLQGRHADARKAYEDATAVFERLAQLHPDNAPWKHDVFISYLKIGDLLRRTSDFPGALAALAKARETIEPLSRMDPSNTGWLNEVSVTLCVTGDTLLAQGVFSEALRNFRDCLAGLERIMAEPGNQELQRNLAATHSKIAVALQRLNDPSKARGELAKARAIAARLLLELPGNADLRNDLASIDLRISDLGP